MTTAAPLDQTSPSEFALPGAAADIGARVSSTLISETRKALREADAMCSATIAEAQQALANAKQQAKHTCDEQVAGLEGEYQRQLTAAATIKAEVTSAIGRLQGARDNAVGHLAKYWVTYALPDSSAAAAAIRDRAIRSFDASDVRGMAAQLTAKVVPEFSELARATPLKFIPSQVEARWVLAIGTIVAALVTWHLAFTWPIIWFAQLVVFERTSTRRLRELLILEVTWSSMLGQMLRGALDRTRTRAKGAHDSALPVVLATRDSQIAEAEADCERRSREATELHATTVASIASRAATTANGLHDEVSRLWSDARHAATPWLSESWTAWAPDSSPEFAASIGTYTVHADDLSGRFQGIDFCFVLPALVPFGDGRCLLLHADGAARGHAASAMRSTLLRVLANTPPGRARFTFLDPIGLGSNVVDFMQLGDYAQTLISGKAWTEPRHIEEQLLELTEHMETVIQKYLRTEFATIHDYNLQAHEVAEPFRFLVVFDLPVNLTDEAARRLVSIVHHGPRCGVYTLIVRDTTRPLPREFPLAELERYSAAVECNKDGFGHAKWLEGPDGAGTVKLDSLDNEPNTAQRIVRLSGEAAVGAMHVEVPFERLLTMSRLGSNGWWADSSAKGLRLPLGPAGARRVQDMVLDQGQESHALVVGRAGSGKTNPLCQYE